MYFQYNFWMNYSNISGLNITNIRYQLYLAIYRDLMKTS